MGCRVREIVSDRMRQPRSELMKTRIQSSSPPPSFSTNDCDSNT